MCLDEQMTDLLWYYIVVEVRVASLGLRYLELSQYHGM